MGVGEKHSSPMTTLRVFTGFLLCCDPRFIFYIVFFPPIYFNFFSLTTVSKAKYETATVRHVYMDSCARFDAFRLFGILI